MPAKKAASNRALKSALARADKHRPSRADYAEAPELTAKDLARAVRKFGGVPRGRPKPNNRDD